MTREPLTYFNASSHGNGMEGLLNWSNVASGNWLVSLFLLISCGIWIYVATKNEYKIGGQVAWICFVMFLLSMIAQTFTEINQIILFIFAIGVLVGVVIHAVENANS